MKMDHSSIEKKWQEKWDGAWRTMSAAEDFSSKPKCYLLVEFPYPSGEGLHMGHPRSYVAMDIVARKRRMEGWNVLYPIGWDAFGLPAENFAIKTGQHPKVTTQKNIETFRRQLKSLGISFDWSREVDTTDPKYYRWTQWMFLQFFKHGLAYKAKMPINWCLSCKIGLANEEVVDGKCERCSGPIEKRDKEQWMIAITKYADRLLADLNTVNYLPKIKKQQEDWIGKSEGAEIAFALNVPGQPDSKHSVTVFTTRPDTLFGATFLVVSPEVAKKWMDVGWQAPDEVRTYVAAALSRAEMERTAEGKEKTGVDTGVVAINPGSKEKISVWVADYVLGHYGTGAIMAVPAHDERDFAFAKKYNLPIRPVILRREEKSRSFVMGVVEDDLRDFDATIVEKTSAGFFKIFIPFEKLEAYKKFICQKMKPHFWNEYSTPSGFHFIFKHTDGTLEEFDLSPETNDTIDRYGETFNDRPAPETPSNVYGWLAENGFYKEILIHTGFGILVNSGKFDGLDSEAAKKKITVAVGGTLKTTYKLRDWVFSRQRYWGEPIPIIHCEQCGQVMVPDDELPVLLPEVEKYQPTDTGESPLAAMTEWVNTKCPTCNGPAKRETDVMPNWAGSSWYFLRYIDPKNDQAFAAKDKLKYWMPIDWYNGGMEHTTLHLLYSRFWNKFLFDIGVAPTSEPYARRTSHGMILGEDGEKMSKSRGNVINPDAIVKEHGADTMRCYEMFIGPFDQAAPWNSQGVIGARRFLEHVYGLAAKITSYELPVTSYTQLARVVHQTVKKVGDDIEAMKFNTAISQMMVCVNAFADAEKIPQALFELFVRALSPFAPHLAEELWEKLGHKESVMTSPWPVHDPELVKEQEIELVVQVNGKVRDTITMPAGLSDEELKTRALASEKIQQWLAGKTPQKVMVVKGKLVSIVI